GLHRTEGPGREFPGYSHLPCAALVLQIMSPPGWADHKEAGMGIRRGLLSLAAFLTALAIPALGQVVAPGVGPNGGAGQSAPPIPDFSGIWAHLTWPDFEPPLAGLGPVTNRSRRGEAGNNYELVGDHTNPILKPHAAEVVKRHGEISLTGVPYPTPSNQCWPGGMPFVLWNIGMQMLQKPDKIVILYSNDHE